jgi:CheY-like chemotaxis protein
MTAADLDQARTLHSVLMELFVANPGGRSDRALLARITSLCEAALAAMDDLEARVAMRGVQNYASLLFSDQQDHDIRYGSLSGPEALRLQIFNSLSAYRGRINAMTTRSPSEPELPALGAQKNRKVVVVEDNRDSAESLRKLLELCGYQVWTAYSGQQALNIVRQKQPDVVLCDIGLPDIDGFSLAESLRANPATARVRLIAVTAYGKEEDRRRSREVGFQAHLVKPVDPELLLEQLAETGC